MEISIILLLVDSISSIPLNFLFMDALAASNGSSSLSDDFFVDALAESNGSSSLSDDISADGLVGVSSLIGSAASLLNW